MQSRFVGSQSFKRKDENNEDEGNDGKCLGCSRLSRSATDQQGCFCTYHHTVVPGKNGEFVQSCYQIPAGSDVTSDKNADGKRREWVHGSLSQTAPPHFTGLNAAGHVLS